MAGGPSIFAAAKYLNKSLRGVNFTTPTEFYVALCTTSSETNLRANNIASAFEVSGGGYSRKLVTLAQIVEVTPGQVAISVDVDFGTATASWGTVQQGVLMDALTGGNVWHFGPLTSPAIINNTDAFLIPANTFVVNL